MRTLPINKAMSYLAPSLLTTGLFISSTLAGMPLQGVLTTTSKPVRETALSSKTETGNLVKNPVLVRNTTSRAEPVVTVTTTGTKPQDQKAISRCWKRLMNMVREVNYAHRSKREASK